MTASDDSLSPDGKEVMVPSSRDAWRRWLATNPQRKDGPALRLSFSRNNIEEIDTGIARLCGVIADCIKDPGLLDKEASGYKELF